jgi:hypothetical protein
MKRATYLLEEEIDHIYEEIWDGIGNGKSIDEINRLTYYVKDLEKELYEQTN